MKATELRLGNFVDSLESEEPDVWALKSITFSDLHTISQFSINQLYRPAVITPETLLRLGFKQKFEGIFCLGQYEAWNNHTQPSSWTFREFIKDPHWCEKCSEWRQQAINYDNELMFVHTLQNLYYTLTKKELEIS